MEKKKREGGGGGISLTRLGALGVGNYFIYVTLKYFSTEQ
jgi:hypothetical protein